MMLIRRWVDGGGVEVGEGIQGLPFYLVKGDVTQRVKKTRLEVGYNGGGVRSQAEDL